MYEFAIAIAAFDKPGVFGDLQPDTGMAQRPFAAVTGDAVGVHDLGFWRGLAHGDVLGLGCFLPLVMPKQRWRGKGWLAPVDAQLITIVPGRADMDVGDAGIGKNSFDIGGDIGRWDDLAGAIDDAVLRAISLEQIIG